MILAALLLGLASAIVELSLYFRFGLLRKWIERWELLGLAFSICLTLLFGHLFGAVGVTALIGAMVAIAMTQPVYFVSNRVRKVDWSRFGRKPKFTVVDGGVAA